MSNHTKQENAEIAKTQNTEEQRGSNQQAIEMPVINLKVEQLEERANPAKPVVLC